MVAFKRLKVRASKRGKGLFADENIRKNEKILDMPGKIVTEEKTDEWDLQIGKNRFIKAPKCSIDRWLNHSCRPNCCLKKIGKRFYLVSIKDILKGEEITFDYDTADYDNERFGFTCRCEAKSCRKNIKGFKFLNLQQKRKLVDHLVPYLKEIFEKEARKNL